MSAINTRSYVVIPARLHSTRLPHKLLLRETGRTVLQHTYEAALTAQRPAEVIIATDHLDIVREVERFGGQAVMTDPEAKSGTDRVAEVARQLTDAGTIVNVQADEPDVCGAHIDLLIDQLSHQPKASIATLAAPIRTAATLMDPARVKVVADRHGRAIYFSRSPIPHVRAGWETVNWESQTDFWQHIGLYAYRREFLLDISSLPDSPLEQLECLEQLRFLAAGYAIQVSCIDHASVGIDTIDDYRAFVHRRAG